MTDTPAHQDGDEDTAVPPEFQGDYQGYGSPRSDSGSGTTSSDDSSNLSDEQKGARAFELFESVVAIAEEEPTDPYEERYYYAVRLTSGGKTEEFYWNEVELRVGDLCLVEGAEGFEFGVTSIARRPVCLCPKKRNKKRGRVIRKADGEDQLKAVDLAGREQSALSYCRKKIAAMGLDMSLSRVLISFDRGRAVFYFTAEGRIDFRELVRDLAGFTNARVEMRQIGVRDEARLLGGCGPCGTSLCCSNFLEDFAPVSIRMAKDQSLSLNPVKISGVCGRLMCCLSYEHETYRHISKKAPKLGKMITAPDGRLGKVVQLNLLKEQAVLYFEDRTKVDFSIYDLRPRDQAGSPLDRPLYQSEEQLEALAAAAEASEAAEEQPQWATIRDQDFISTHADPHVSVSDGAPSERDTERGPRKPRRRKKKRSGGAQGTGQPTGQGNERPAGQSAGPATGAGSGNRRIRPAGQNPSGERKERLENTSSRSGGSENRPPRPENRTVEPRPSEGGGEGRNRKRRRRKPSQDSRLAGEGIPTSSHTPQLMPPRPPRDRREEATPSPPAEGGDAAARKRKRRRRSRRRPGEGGDSGSSSSSSEGSSGGAES